MKILFTRFPLESRFGGAEVQTLALMKGLRERGHEVVFLGSCPVLLEETKKLRMENGELRIGIPPVTKWSVVSFLWRQFSMRKALNSPFSILHSQFRFDAVVMLSLTEKLLLTPILHRQGIKTFWLEHDRVGRWLTLNPWLWKLRKLSRLATTIVVSDLSKKIYADLGFQNVIAIPNGIDSSRLKSDEQTRKPAHQQTFHVGTVARLSKEKGVDVLMDAVKDLPDVALTIVGTGPDEKKLLTSKLANLPVRQAGQQTKILPYVDNLSDFYANLDVFVLPSREHDPFGLVAGEAMLMGIPTIVTDACGIAGYLEHGRDAWIVPAGSSKALHAAILELQHDTEKRAFLGTMGKGKAEEKFGMTTMVDRYEKVLDENHGKKS